MINPNISLAIRQDYKTGNYTNSELARKYQVHRHTIENILKRTEDKDIYSRTTTPGNLLITPYKTQIRKWLKKGDMQATTIHHKLTRMGANLSYSTVAKAVRQIKYELDLAVIRYETSPGTQAQADWGEFPGFTATIDGIERQLYAFFLILGYSRMRYVEFTTSMTTEVLISCIENAFRYFGGRPKEILFDNMPQVVNRCLIDRNTKDRALIPEFTTFADYYCFDIRLARIRRPQEKGKVERFVGYFKDDFMPGLEKKTGHDLANLNSRALEWCDDANAKVHSTTGEVPFKRLPLENLIEIPKIRYLDNKTIYIDRDGSTCYRGHVYKVDRRFAESTGEVIDMQNTIFAKIDGELVILGNRRLPVYARNAYCHIKTKPLARKKQRCCKDPDTPDWLENLPGKYKISWKDLTCTMEKCI